VRVLAATQDEGGCRFYRVTEPGRVLTEQFDVDFRVDGWVNVDAVEVDGKVTVNEVQEEVDVLLVQRPLHDHFLPVIAQAQRQGIAVVVELDDHFSAIHPRNRVYGNVQPDKSPRMNWRWLERVCAEADLVITSTQALADHYAPHRRYEVIRNCVPASALEVEGAPRSSVRVGWTGTVQTHPGDLEVVGDGVARALADTSAEMFVIGDAWGVGPSLRLPPAPLVESTGWVPLSDYYQTIADAVDVGIVPLEQSTFNNAKSWLKGLEFAALGIPAVATPTPEYKLLSAYGGVELATSPGDWRKKVGDLVRNGRKRTAAAARGREIVRQNFTYELNAYRWYDALQTAIEHRKASSSGSDS
jgi:glycosyltransferase involved in cell wall biosynthesis